METTNLEKMQWANDINWKALVKHCTPWIPSRNQIGNYLPTTSTLLQSLLYKTNYGNPVTSCRKASYGLKRDDEREQTARLSETAANNNNTCLSLQNDA